MSFQSPPLAIGDYTTDDSLDADLGKTYRAAYKDSSGNLTDGLFRFVKLTAAVSDAGGKVVIHSLSSGRVNGNAVETTTASDVEVAGVIPVYGNIAATTHLAADTRLLVQVNGPARVKAGNTTVVAGGALVTATTSGAVQSMATGVEAATAVQAYLGYATNTAAATAASQLITCVLTRTA